MNILLNSEIDIDDYLYMLYHRGFTTELAIEHTERFYNIPSHTFFNNISKLDHKINFDDNDYYFTGDSLDDDNRTKIRFDLSVVYDDRSKATFNWRKIYSRFDWINTLGIDEIHHIYPVYLGGSNSFYNLIGVDKIIHSYLHDAWWENDENLCNKAVDYLCILSWQKPAFSIIQNIYDESLDKKFMKTRFQNEICMSLMKYMENFKNDRTK